ncbi:hypothetical protein ACI6PS_07900 [Flavobacterium sp. PLA-1-15]|uniref:hypothetical protein n=1 Tax=Flavobacterium sp. PLA-1-15 TaxID=3380533 RepID=UPI003B82090C
MGNLDRKDFLKLTAWSFMATMLPVGRITAIAAVFDTTTNIIPANDDYIKALALAKTAKDAFYKKDFARAETLYLDCIKLAPRAIRFYDNLDNVYGAQGEVLASVELYRKGLLANPTIVSFYDRAARSLLRLETGRKLLARNYQQKISSASLLKDAESLYLKALEIDAKKAYLRIGLDKISEKMKNSSMQKDVSQKKEQKARKKQRKTLLKSHFDNKTNRDIEILIEKTASKKRTKLYVAKEVQQQERHILQQQKKYYRLLLSRKLMDNETIHYAERLFELDNGDTRSLRILKKEYYKSGKFRELIQAREQFAAKKQSLFSFLGVMDAIEQAYKKGQVGADYLDRAHSIGKELMTNWMLIPRTEVDVVDKLAKVMVLQSNYTEAKAITKASLLRFHTTSPAVTNKMMYRYAKIFFEERQYEQAKKILLIALQEQERTEDDLQFLQTIANGKEQETLADKTILLYLLHSTYSALNEKEQAYAVLEKLRIEDPKDRFVLTRK